MKVIFINPLQTESANKAASMEIMLSDEDSEDRKECRSIGPFTRRPIDSAVKKNTSKQRREEEELNILKSDASSLSNESVKDNTITTFTAYVGKALADMDNRTRMLTMKNKQHVIFKIQMAQIEMNRGAAARQTTAATKIGQNTTTRFSHHPSSINDGLSLSEL